MPKITTLRALLVVCVVGTLHIGSVLGQQAQPQPKPPRIHTAQTDIRADGTIIQHDAEGGTITYKSDGATAVYVDPDGESFTLEMGADGNTVMVDAKGQRMAPDDNPIAVQKKQMSEGMQKALGATAKEWAAMEPKILKIQSLNRDLRGGIRIGNVEFTGSFALGGPPSDTLKATHELNKLLANKDSSPNDIKAAINTLHDLKAKTRIELDKTVKELKELLKPRQEAILITNGTLQQ